MSRLLYIPSGTFCSFHRDGCGTRTLIIEESAIYEEWNSVEKSMEALFRAIRDTQGGNFVRVNKLSIPILREEFEVTNE